jgi:hypothetical protein
VPSSSDVRVGVKDVPPGGLRQRSLWRNARRRERARPEAPSVNPMVTARLLTIASEGPWDRGNPCPRQPGPKGATGGIGRFSGDGKTSRPPGRAAARSRRAGPRPACTGLRACPGHRLALLPLVLA